MAIIYLGNNWLNLKGREKMIQLTKTELQNLKYLIVICDISYHKFNLYSSNCVDPQIKQMFTKATQDVLNTKQKLIGILN